MKAILYHVRPDAACPECRTGGVFVLAHELTHTDELLRKRCSPPQSFDVPFMRVWLSK